MTENRKEKCSMSFKNMLAFLAGGLTFSWLFSKGLKEKTVHPIEGTVIYEDDQIKVTRMSAEKGKKYDLATITYMEQTVDAETEEA